MLKIQPICDALYCVSWCVEKYDSKTADELMMPKTDSMAQNEPTTASQPWRPPSGNVNADEVDIREATRSGSVEGSRPACTLVDDLDWELRPCSSWSHACSPSPCPCEPPPQRCSLVTWMWSWSSS